MTVECTYNGEKTTHTLIDEKWIWIGHSHPTIYDLMESNEDIETLKLLTWQEESSIFDLNGDIKKFRYRTLGERIIGNMKRVIKCK